LSAASCGIAIPLGQEIGLHMASRHRPGGDLGRPSKFGTPSARASSRWTRIWPGFGGAARAGVDRRRVRRYPPDATSLISQHAGARAGCVLT
jgi:hypothetical protein